MGDNKRLKSIKAVIDTGFTGDLTVPKAVIEELGFGLRGIQEVVLGDGSTQFFEMYVGSVIWDGQMKRVEVNAAETDALIGMGLLALIGMGLLEDYKLEMECKPSGEVRITSLPAFSAV